MMKESRCNNDHVGHADRHGEVPSITLYGLMDAGMGYTRLSGACIPQPDAPCQSARAAWAPWSGGASGPRWGLRGKEDLGDGLHAVFQLESGFDSRNGRSLQGRLFGRQATVGLLNARWASCVWAVSTTPPRATSSTCWVRHSAVSACCILGTDWA